MADELIGFDASHLDGLAKIKAEQQSLRDLARRAAEHRDKVTEVYSRVVRDYEARISGLEEQAQALRGHLRDEFSKLEVAYEAARQALDQARFDLQESEFRKEIGEYTAEEFQRRQQAIEANIAAKQRELEGIARIRSRFLDLLPSEALPPAPVPAVAAPAIPPPAPAPAPAKAAPSPVVPLPTPQPIAAPVPPAPAPSAASQANTTPPPVVKVDAPAEDGSPGPAVAVAAATVGGATVAGTSAAAAVAPPPPPSGIGETMVLPPPGSAIFRMPAMPGGADDGATQILAPPPLKPAAGETAEAFATVAIPAGALIEEKAAGAPVSHRLGPSTTIGRTPDNQIVIPSREVSRKHAEVLLGQAGYTLRDLGSPNGTFVNGKKITEHPLQDGDRITLAGAVFIFKAK